MKVLITSASRKVVLVRSFKQYAIVYATDIDSLSPAIYVADFFYKAPLTLSPEFPKFVLDLVKREKIDLVVPTTDDDLLVIASIREALFEEGVFPLVSPLDVVLTCNDKLKTLFFFKENGIPTPDTFTLDEFKRGYTLPFKAMFKKRFGRGSRGNFSLNKGEVIPESISEDYLIQRYIEGREYTIDAFVDLEGKVISVVPRERILVSDGVSIRGRTVRSSELISWGRKICEILRPLGPVNIQCIWGEEGLFFIEINPRFSGGIALTLASGANFVKWSLDLACGKKLSPFYDFEELYMSCYNDPIFFKTPLGGV
ncbi:MAG: ATP-grasp domain-containing protein [Synergistetes bacterium]|nr:ATP-grasp domain-containing protein [Synergistota bacterium]